MKQLRGRQATPGAVWRPAAVRVARTLGSLQLAVTLLPTLAVVLFLGTVVESRHGRPAAADLVYRTWWFVLLLGALAANIFCAAAKKWPWKRHQIGFIITHIGLLTLIAGGVIDSVAGTTGSVMLIDTPDGRGPQRTSFVVDRTAQRLKVRRPQRPNAEPTDESFHPGPLAWGDDESRPPEAEPDLLTQVLAFLRNPMSDGWSRALGDGARLEVLTYYPHARVEPYGYADVGRGSFPAAQFQLASTAAGVIAPRWVAFDPANPAVRLGPGRVEFIGQELTPQQIAEFRATSSDVSANDPRRGDSSVRAVLQFVTDRDEKLHYRSFTSSRGGSTLTLEGAGEVKAGGDWKPIWAGMDWRFRVTQFVPGATAGLHCRPVDRPASAEGLTEPPAVFCRLTKGNDSTKFWIARSDDEWTSISVGGERFDIGYHPTRHELGFELTLVRAEQMTEAASGRPAGLTSYVLLNDAARGRQDEPYVITLNDPLAYSGYRVYQGGLSPLEPDERGRPVHRVTLLANRDPGVWFKYAGSAGVALGIACMFYMRAYFFKKRGA